MALTGLKYPVFAKINSGGEGSAVVYAKGTVVGKARNCNVSWDYSDAEFYADDVLIESENIITGGTLSFELDDMSPTVMADMFGLTKGTGDEVTETGEDAPYGGFGYITCGKKSGATYYEAWWIFKAQFKLGAQSVATKEKSTTFNGAPIDGKIMAVQIDNTGKNQWRVHKRCTTYADAVTYINTKAGITA